MIQTREIGPIKIYFGKLPSYPYCNTLLVKGRRTLLVDPACEENVLRALAQEERIDHLFNTHYHPDHIRYNSLFAGSEFWTHRDDAPCFRSLDSMAEWVGVKDTPYEKNWKTTLTRQFGFRERREIKEVEEGSLLDLGGVRLEFLHFPGHTPGLTGFLVREFGVLFLADMELSPHGPWYHNQKASIQGIIDSVEKIRRIHADYYLPSHGREISRSQIGPRLDRYLENIACREKRILESLTHPKTLDEIASQSLISGFRLSRTQIWFYFERTMIEKHLHRLLEQKRISKVGDKFQREDR